MPNSYIERVRKIPRLSREEETTLAIAAKAGDRKARDKLFLANARYVVDMALKIPRRGLDLDECIAEGNIGLVYALEHFDPTRGIRFVTFAGFQIRRHIWRFIFKNWTIVPPKLTNENGRLFWRLGRARKELEAQGLTLSEGNEEIAKRFGTSAARVAEMTYHMGAGDGSLDAPDTRSGRNEPLVEMTPSPVSPPEILVASAEETAWVLPKALACLRPREREIVQARILVDDDDQPTLRELGAKMAISKERVRQLEAEAIERMRIAVRRAE